MALRFTAGCGSGGGDLSSAAKPVVNHTALSSFTSPPSLLSLSSHPSFLPSASAVSRRRTRISLDLLNTAMTALPTPSIVSHSYFTLPRKGLRKFGSWTMHILENLHLSRHYNFGFIPNCSNAYVVTAKNGCCNLQLNVQIHRDRQKGFPQVP